MPSKEKNWEKWLQIEDQVRRWVRCRWWDPHRAEDVMQGAAELFARGRPRAGKELGYAALKCRESARNQGLWAPGKVREIAMDPADLPLLPDRRDPEALLIQAQEAAEQVAREALATQMIALLSAPLCAAADAALKTSMAAACRSAGIPQQRLSDSLGRIGQRISGRPRVICRPRQSRAARAATAAGQMTLGLV